jgi:hypothetical protein
VLSYSRRPTAASDLVQCPDAARVTQYHHGNQHHPLRYIDYFKRLRDLGMPDSSPAQAIGIFATLIVLAGLLLGVPLSQIFGSQVGWSGAKLFLATLALGVIGLGSGVLIVIANSYIAARSVGR